MRISRLLLFCAILFFLKESAIAQPENFFKNNFKADSVKNTDSTRRAKSREFWSHYFPAISVSGGFHSNMLSREDKLAFKIGPVWKAVINIPFDSSHIVNWEGSFHMMYGKDSLGNVVSTYGGYPIGMRFYFTERNTAFRPFINFGLSHARFLFFHISNGGGIDYAINPSLAAQFSIEHLYSYRKETFGNGTFAIPYTSFAGFLGIRYQL